MKLNRILLLSIIFIILISCMNNPKKEFKKIIKLTNYYKYEEALDKLKRFEKKYPNFTYDGVKAIIPILKCKCYEVMGDFKNLEKESVKISGNTAQSGFNMFLGIEFYEIILHRSFIKVFDFDKGAEITNKLTSLEEDFRNKKNSILQFLRSKKENFYYLILREGRVDKLMLDIIQYSVLNVIQSATADRKNEYLLTIDDDIDTLLIYLSQVNKKSEVKWVFADLLNYKTVDGQYYSDLIWTRDITKQYFKKFVDNKLITKKTLKQLKKILYRDKFPKDFLDLFSEYFVVDTKYY